jgi:hypothetical protein
MSRGPCSAVRLQRRGRREPDLRRDGDLTERAGDAPAELGRVPDQVRAGDVRGLGDDLGLGGGDLTLPGAGQTAFETGLADGLLRGLVLGPDARGDRL